MAESISPELWWTFFAVSVVFFVGTLLLVPWIIVRLPADYFTLRKTALRSRSGREVSRKRLAVRIIRNLLGGLVLLIGFAMLVLPGQGLLTILIAIMLVDFPRKFRFERWLACRSHVMQAMNWIRHRAGRPPLIVSHSQSSPR